MAGPRFAPQHSMATRTVADRPFKDLDVLDSGPRGGAASAVSTVDAVGLVGEICDETAETDDALSPSRGILLALLLAAPFWIAVVYWLVW
jgi:hypothetical protein